MGKSKTQKIVNNTIVLYIRMLVTMLIALFTSRVLLQALGVNDYGLYNVVGGVVSLFAFLMSSMASTTQRFLSYELGSGDEESLSNVFSMSLTTHLFIAFIVLILSELIGLWFLNTYIQIPEGRVFAANFVYQFVVLSLCLNIIIVPYSACVITHEEMTFYAYITIFDSVAKLAIAYILLICEFDKLCFYGFLLCLVTFIDYLCYYYICSKRYKETKYRFFFDKRLFKRIFSFSGWTILGQMAVVGASQGTCVLLNIYHSVIFNASFGIANQVNGALNGLVSNFQTAFQPQITKSYAGAEYDSMYRLMHNASKISFFLLFIVSIPVVTNIDWILELWLKEVPTSTNTFCIIFITSSLLNSIGGPLWMSVFATGNIRNYQISVFLAYAISLLCVFCLFEAGNNPVIGVAVNAMVSVALLILRLYYAKNKLQFFSIKDFLISVLLPIFTCILLVAVCNYLVLHFNFTTNRLLKTGIVFAFSIFTIFQFGLNKEERKNTLCLIYKIIKR